jgi:hypothetical protein
MCSIVGIEGINFNNFDFTKDNWYQKYQWSASQEQEFIKWMQEYLMKNKEARNEIMARPNKTKRDIERTVNEFVNTYGWKTNYEEEI